jgi:hypothetical protein
MLKCILRIKFEDVRKSLNNKQWTEFELATLVVICTDCIDSCKSNSHKITTVPVS